MSPMNTELEKTSTWQRLVNNKKQWLASIVKSQDTAEFEGETDIAFGKDTSDFVTCFIPAISPCPEKTISASKDLRIMKSAIASIAKSVEENILTDREASALLEFITSAFVGRRLDSLFFHVFAIGSFNECRFHAFGRTCK